MVGALNRRRLLALAACAAIPGATRAQGPTRTVAFLFGLANDSEAQVRVKAFEQGLERQGWTVGQDVQILYRFAEGDAARMQSIAAEFVALRPDVIVAHSTPVAAAVLRATRMIPVVFVVVADPVGSGFAASIARPGGNATGFTNLDSTITAKLLTVLKQIAPKVTEVALMYNPDTVASQGRFYFRPFEEAAPAFGVVPLALHVRSPAEIEQRMAEIAARPNAGLVVMPDNFTTVHREQIVALATRHRLPAIYPYRYFAEAGGLMSYGVDVTDLFRRAPEYVSRILRGANAGDLPVQAPTKFELVINLRVARELQIPVPRHMLASADSLID